MNTIFNMLGAAFELLLTLLQYTAVMLVLVSPYIAEALMDRWLGL